MTNTSDYTMRDWEIVYKMDDQIVNIWNGDYLINGEEVRIKNKGYNKNIYPGNQVSIGYIATKVGEIDIPSAYSFTNYYSSSESEYKINYIVENEWDSGYISVISIENLSNEIIEDWMLEFEFDQTISNIWGAEINSTDDGYYEVVNSNYNSNIYPGETVEFRVMIQEGNVISEPHSYELLSVKMK